MPQKVDNSLLILLMSGAGSRFGGALPKQFLTFRESPKPVFQVTLENILSAISFTDILLTVHPQYLEADELIKPLNELKKAYAGINWHITGGGKTRHESFVMSANYAKNGNLKVEKCLIHDANRPYLSPQYMARILKAMNSLGETNPCSIPVIPLTDSICHAQNNRVNQYVDRSELFRIQTPQLIYGPALFSAIEKDEENVRDKLVNNLDHAGLPADFTPMFAHEFTDEGSFMKEMGYEVGVFEGDPENVKITYPGDLQ